MNKSPKLVFLENNIEAIAATKAFTEDWLKFERDGG